MVGTRVRVSPRSFNPMAIKSAHPFGGSPASPRDTFIYVRSSGRRAVVSGEFSDDGNVHAASVRCEKEKKMAGARGTIETGRYSHAKA